MKYSCTGPLKGGVVGYVTVCLLEYFRGKAGPTVNNVISHEEAVGLLLNTIIIRGLLKNVLIMMKNNV